MLLPKSSIFNPPGSFSQLLLLFCTSMESSKVKLRLKLLVDKARRKVLFAEAGKDVVDFLFGILALPLGDVVRLLNKQSMVGCLGKLYESVESFDDAYMLEANQSKSHLLSPRVVAFSGNDAGAALTWKKEETPAPRKYYRCADYQSPNRGVVFAPPKRGCEYFSDGLGATCPGCSSSMTTEMKYVPLPAGRNKVGSTATSSVGTGEGGFVKGVVTYMVMDDLAVAPMSTISSIALLNKFGVKDVGSLEETTMDLDMSKALEMLKASLQSTTVLTDVFLPKKRSPKSEGETGFKSL